MSGTTTTSSQWWRLASTTAEKIGVESTKTDLHLHRLVLLCNTYDKVRISHFPSRHIVFDDGNDDHPETTPPYQLHSALGVIVEEFELEGDDDDGYYSGDESSKIRPGENFDHTFNIDSSDDETEYMVPESSPASDNGMNAQHTLHRPKVGDGAKPLYHFSLPLPSTTTSRSISSRSKTTIDVSNRREPLCSKR